jgi:uncharacterized protein YeaO (DUF488 family)
MIQLKRVYDPASSTDGIRFLIERLWPRGMKKTSLRLDAWLKEVGPSTKLRRWFSHDLKKWDLFRRRYFSELRQNAKVWAPILKAGSISAFRSNVTTTRGGCLADGPELQDARQARGCSDGPDGVEIQGTSPRTQVRRQDFCTDRCESHSDARGGRSLLAFLRDVCWHLSVHSRTTKRLRRIARFC